MVEFKDKAGKKLEKWDLVVYAYSVASSVYLRYGVVVGTQEAKESYGGERARKVKVIAIDDSWTSRGPALLKAPVILGFSSKILRIEEDQLPDGYLSLLDKGMSEYEERHK